MRSQFQIFNAVQAASICGSDCFMMTREEAESMRDCLSPECAPEFIRGLRYSHKPGDFICYWMGLSVILAPTNHKNRPHCMSEGGCIMEAEK